MSRLSRFQIRIIGPEGERVERLNKDEMVIGRSAQSDIVVANAEVSRKHVTLRVEGEQLLVVDEGSKNGTFLEGTRLPAQMPRAWPVGQALKLGLAPEKLALEHAVDHKDTPEAPPPVDITMSRSGTRWPKLNPTPATPGPVVPAVAASAPASEKKVVTQIKNDNSSDELNLGDLEASEPPIHQTDRLGEKIQSPFRTKAQVQAEKPRASATSAADLMGELEKKMQEVLARAEAEAKNLRKNAEQEAKTLQKTLHEEIHPKTAVSDAQLFEKAKLESQLRELQEEIKKRSNERKTLARDHAEAKLNLQNAEQELKRFELAKVQLSQQLGSEISTMEKRLEDLHSQVNKETEAHQQKLQKEARELIEGAKKQAELLIADAEVKAKAQREKLQLKMSDQIKSNELELAELKIKQVADFKSQQERMESGWQKEKQKTSLLFMADIRDKMEKSVYSSELDSALKMRLLTDLEESLHVHFAAAKPERTLAQKHELEDDQNAVTVVRAVPSELRLKPPMAAAAEKKPMPRPTPPPAPLAGDEEGEEPPSLTRVLLRFTPGLTFAFVCAVLGGGWWFWKHQDEATLAKAHIAEPVVQSPVVAQAPPLPTPPPPPPVVEPVEPATAAVTSAVIPASAAVTAPVVTQSPKIPPPAAAPLVVAPKPQRAPVSVKPAVKAPAPKKVSREEVISWIDVAMAKPTGTWQSAAVRFLETQKVERSKIRRYHQLEERFALQVDEKLAEDPDDIQAQQRLESQFVKEAKSILGPAIWSKLLAYRDNYWR